MVLTKDRVTAEYSVVTALSYCHSKGTLFVDSDTIAEVAGMPAPHVRLALADMEGYGWLYFDIRGAGYRLRDRVVATVYGRRLCDVCLYEENGTRTDAIADCRTKYGNWANVCARHFISHAGFIGEGSGQFLRFED
jgi:hypothetical protein